MTFNHIKHKHIKGNASPIIKHWRNVPTCTMDEDDVDVAVDCNISGPPSSIAPLLPRIYKSARGMTRSLHTILMTVNFSFQVRLLCQWLTSRIWHRIFFTLKWNLALGLVLLPLIEVEVWDKPSEDCCWAWARDQLMCT